MRATGICLVLTLLAAAAVAQQPPPAMKTFTSSAEITALIAKAKSERKGDAPLVAERILSLAPYNANLEYRGAVGPAAVHEKEAEMFYVIDGSATLVTGGKLVNESRTNPENLTGTAIENGKSQAVAHELACVLLRSTSEATPSFDSKPKRSFCVTRRVQILSNAPIKTMGPSRSCKKEASEAGTTRNALCRTSSAAAVRVRVMTSASARLPE